MEKRKSRIEAARELLAIANCYEPRRHGNWHMTGRAHDYTA